MDPKLLKTGDILHCRGKSIISKLIMWATKSKWSHTAVFIEIWGQPFIIEAQAKGVYVIPYFEWLKEWQYDFEVSRNIQLTDYRLYSIMAMSKVGHTGYDFASLLIRKPIQIITGKWRKRAVEDDRQFCSEYALWTHDVVKSYSMSPQDVYEYTHSTNGWVDVKPEY